MKNLIRWELRQTFTSTACWGIGIALTAATLLLTLSPLSESGYTGFDVFLQCCNNFNSFMVFVIGIFSGIHVTGAFEERRIQAAVMAGYNRFSVLSAKLLSFSLPVALYCVCSLSAGGVLAFSVKGLNGFEGSFLREVVLRIAAYALVEVSFAGACFFVSVMVKSLGASIAVNLITMLTLHSLAQELVSDDRTVGLTKLTAAGQSFALLWDAGTKNLLLSAAVSLLGLALVLVLSFIKLRKQELK